MHVCVTLSPLALLSCAFASLCLLGMPTSGGVSLHVCVPDTFLPLLRGLWAVSVSVGAERRRSALC